VNLSIIRLLAWRYFTSTSSSTIRTMIGVCCASIFIGTFALALIASIMRGFEYETHKKLQSIYPSIIIKAPDNSTLAYKPLTAFLKQTLSTNIIAVSPYVMKQGLIHEATTEEPTYVVTVKGIDPRHEGKVTALEGMTQPSTALKNLKDQEIILGEDLAHSLNVTIKDQVVLVCNEQEDTGFKDAQLISIPVTVVGIVTTGISDYDQHLVLAHLGLCKKIWGNDCVTHLGVSLPTPAFEKVVLKELEKIKEIECHSWKKLYPALVSSLDLEQYVMFFLLLLITLVASMNIVSLLFMYITYKRTDIALLKMLGMKNWHINLVFLCLSLIIASLAATTGLGAAYLTGRLLQLYPCIKLPSDVYYVTHLPIRLDGWLFLIVFASVIALSIGASLLPIRTIRRLNITHTLRFE
jgi:lipoprotein-releasing system permease protein